MSTNIHGGNAAADVSTNRRRQQIQVRSDNAARWTATNPVLAAGEIGHDLTNNAVRIGDGVTAWESLSVIGGEADAVDVVSNVATARILGRTTAGAGNSEELTAAQVKTLLAISAGDVTGSPIQAQFVVLEAVNRATWTAPAPLPGLTVVLGGQATAAENGVYTTTTGGALDLGTHVDIFTSAYYGRIVTAPTVVDSSAATVFTYIDPSAYDPTTTRGSGSFTVGTPDGMAYSLYRDIPLADSIAALTGKAFPPAWNDYVISANATLTLNHNVISVTGTGAPITITLAPHATIVRPCFIWNRSAHNVTLVEFPGETNFEHVVAAGERVLVLPDQADWQIWHQPPDIETGDAGKVARVNSGETAYELVTPAAVGFTPTTGADWDGPPTTIQGALDELAARVRILEP